MINNTWIDGYKTLFITFISILVAGCVYFFSSETASLVQQILQQCILPLGIIILGIVANGVIAQYTRAKILSVPPGLRRMVNITPINGWEPIIDAIGALALALITAFIKNTGQATTLSQLVSSVFVPLAMLVIGGQAISLHVSQNKLKLAPITNVAVIGPLVPVPPNPPTPPVPNFPMPPASPVVKAVITPQPVDYVTINLDAMVAAAKDKIVADGGTVDDWSTASYFRAMMVLVDGRTIPDCYKVQEFARCVNQAVALEQKGFTYYTNIPSAPTPAQVANYNSYYLTLKELYMKANNMPCGNRTFAELKAWIEDINNLYQAQAGLQNLAQLQSQGGVCNWSIYGGEQFGPQEVGLDWVELTTY